MNGHQTSLTTVTTTNSWPVIAATMDPTMQAYLNRNREMVGLMNVVLNVIAAVIALAAPLAIVWAATTEKLRLPDATAMMSGVTIAVIVLTALQQWGAGVGFMLAVCVLTVGYLVKRSKM